MPTVALKAHDDGVRIVLEELFDLPRHSPLIVTVLPEPNTERAQWEALAAESLARVYGADEPEYTLDDVKQQP